MIASLLALLIVGVVGLLAAMVMIVVFSAIVSIVLGIVGFFLFKVAPVLLVGWLVVKVLRSRRTPEGIATSDASWLDR